MVFPQSQESDIQYDSEMKEPEAAIVQDQLFMWADLTAAIQASKKSTAPGIDPISTAAVRSIPGEGPSELLVTYNAIWSKGGNPPAKWKKFGVIPKAMPVKPSTEVKNLRSIYPRQIPANRWRWCCSTRLTWSSRITTDSEECRPVPEQTCPHSTASFWFIMTSCEADPRRPKVLVTVDVKMAFNSVPHISVTAAADNCGLRGNTLNLIKHFLTDCRYEEAIGEFKSTQKL